MPRRGGIDAPGVLRGISARGMERRASLRGKRDPEEVPESGCGMPSRDANDRFWMGTVENRAFILLMTGNIHSWIRILSFLRVSHLIHT